MSLSRYSSSTFGTSPRVLKQINRMIISGEMTYTSFTMKEGQRLDIVAHDQYGDGRLWWIIAAASGIGWWLQVPPGTRIVVPTDLNQILGLL